MDFGNYSIRGLKAWRTDDGGGYELSLLCGGKKVATVLEEGRGGETRFYWANPEAEAVFDKYLATLPIIEIYQGHEIKVDGGVFVEELVGVYEINKRFKRLCKSKIVFTLKDKDKDDTTYNTINRPFNQVTKDLMIAKYGDNLKEIINERF